MTDPFEGLQAPVPFDETAWAWCTDQKREQEVNANMEWVNTSWAHESGYRQFLKEVFDEARSTG